MEKLSVLIFTRNDKLEPLIKNVYNIANEIIIIDSSDKNFEIKNRRLKKKYKKIKIFYVIPTSYPDLLRMYGLKKCNNKWVLLIDTDERVSNDLKKKILEILNKPLADAYKIYRINKYSNYNIYDSVIRLYNKDNIIYKGILHEHPVVLGKMIKLGKKYKILHYPKSLKREYDELMYYQFRLNWKILKYEISERFKNKFLKKMFINIINLYIKIFKIEEKKELSKIEYLLVFLLDAVIASIYRYSFIEFINRLKHHKNFINKLFSSSEKERNIQLKISEKIREYDGIINMLNFENENVIKHLNKKYKNKNIKGANLLIKLLKEKI